MNISSDSELLDFADQFCAKCGHPDRFATLGLSLETGTALSFRQALSRLLIVTKNDPEANRDACFKRAAELLWSGDPNQSCSDVKEQLIREFGTETVEATLAQLKKL